MSLNQENGLPPEVVKFLDRYLPHEADKKLFLAEYAAAHSAQDRAAFLARYAEEPTDEEMTVILRTIAAREKTNLN